MGLIYFMRDDMRQSTL